MKQEYITREDYEVRHTKLEDKIDEKYENLSAKIESLQRLTYIGVGLIIAIQFIMGVILKV